MSETVSLEVAIEVVLRNGPSFETIAGLCKMAVEAEREACAKVCEAMRTYVGSNNAVTQSSAQDCAAAIRAREKNEQR